MTTIPIRPAPIEQRLAALPHKAAQPFRELLRHGQTTEAIVDIILDAGELSGETNRLIGFHAAYHFLRNQDIPVHHVIAMAKSQKRRINLAWSPTRWKDEHDKLSRAEALAKLAGENVTYGLAAYETLLPKQFPGYLIRTSRRLGMEGLRQRHCVASYDSRIRAGNCAIAAVFIDKQRWTVELRIVLNPDAPLAIYQIKGRRNALPTPEVRAQIHRILGIEPPPSFEPDTAPTESGHLYIENLRRVLPILQAHNVPSVEVSFDGSGDSGSIHTIWYSTPELSEAVGKIAVQTIINERYLDDGDWKTRTALTQTTMSDAIESLTYDFLDTTGVDWYNNDGGFGRLEIDVANGTVNLEIDTRYTQSTTEFSQEFDIATGAALE